MVDSSVENVTICIKQVRDLQQHLESESNSTETTEGSEPSTALHRGQIESHYSHKDTKYNNTENI